jgi:regulatory protein
MESETRLIIKKLQQICSRQEKCKADIVDYLFRHEVPDEVHQTVIKSLLKEKFIDEERYARAVVQDKLKLNRWGRIKIRYFLRSRRISEETIQHAMNLIDEDLYRQILEQELNKKARSLVKEEPEIRKLKLQQYAASKGFEEEMVWKMIKQGK